MHLAEDRPRLPAKLFQGECVDKYVKFEDKKEPYTDKEIRLFNRWWRLNRDKVFTNYGLGDLTPPQIMYFTQWVWTESSRS